MVSMQSIKSLPETLLCEILHFLTSEHLVSPGTRKTEDEHLARKTENYFFNSLNSVLKLLNYKKWERRHPGDKRLHHDWWLRKGGSAPG